MPRLNFDCEELLNWWEPKADVSFIFNFNWRSLQQLREAISIFLCSRLHKAAQRGTIAITETGCPRMKDMLASNPNTPGDLLDFLCQVSPRQTLIRVAENPSASKDTLTRLCFHEDAEVRAAVADNPNTPECCYKRLMSDESADVRYQLAENSHTPATILYSLFRDENPYVSHRARQTLGRILSETILETNKLMAPATELNPNLLEMNTSINARFLNELNDLCGNEFVAADFNVQESKV